MTSVVRRYKFSIHNKRSKFKLILPAQPPTLIPFRFCILIRIFKFAWLTCSYSWLLESSVSHLQRSNSIENLSSDAHNKVPNVDKVNLKSEGTNPYGATISPTTAITRRLRRMSLCSPGV
jgi:hypothetical protein